MQFNVTREQWVERFAQRMASLVAGAEPGSFVATAEGLWATRGQLEPEAAADGAFFDQRESRFERTERIPVERIQADEEYVRDDAEWVARCTARVLQLDPIIKADEARRSVGDLAALERWRVMKPENAAEQLYTPIKPRPA